MRRSKSEKSIATRTGDDGLTTQLYGKRISKNHPRVIANGDLDELSSNLGMAKVLCPDTSTKEILQKIQLELITLMGEVGTLSEDQEKYLNSKLPHLNESNLEFLDNLIDELETEERQFNGWVLAGTSTFQAAIHIARAVCRRAERSVLNLREQGEQLRTLPTQYLNRLSDVLWLIGRE